MRPPTQTRQSAADVERRQRSSRSIDTIRDAINNALPLLQDDRLRDRCIDYLERTEQMGSTNLLDQIESELTRLDTEYPMRRVDRGEEDEFPEKCSDCRHSPHACPIFFRSVHRDSRERLSSELVGQPEAEVKRRYRQFASNVGCRVIPKEIDVWETDHADVLGEGQELRREIFTTVYSADPSTAAEEQVDEAVEGAAESGQPTGSDTGASDGGSG